MLVGTMRYWVALEGDESCRRATSARPPLVPDAEVWIVPNVAGGEKPVLSGQWPVARLSILITDY